MSDGIYYHSFLNRDRMIHIVDADPATCEALSILFRLEGFQTIFSLEAAHFIVSLERRRPDIVVLNLRVGEESGLGLLRRVKSMRTGTPVFIIAYGIKLTDTVALIYDRTATRLFLCTYVHLGAAQR
ncbi:response regulator [Devosia sp. A449]